MWLADMRHGRHYHSSVAIEKEGRGNEARVCRAWQRADERAGRRDAQDGKDGGSTADSDPASYRVEAHDSRSAAQKGEAQLKGWTRAKKEALVLADSALLKKLSPTS
jgi:hypothetical protein